MLAVVNTTATALTAGATVPMGSTKVRTNGEASVNNGTIEIQRAGTYEVLSTVVFTATAAGDVTLQMQADGVDVPGALATVTATAAGAVTLPVMATLQARQGAPGARIPLTGTISAAGTLIAANASVKRVI